MSKVEKSPISLSIFLIGVMLLNGCGVTTSSTTVTNRENNSYIVNITDLDQAFEVILENASAEFIGHYPIDEGFLSWVSSCFGADTVKKIAENGDYANPEIWYSFTGKSIYVLWNEYNEALGLSTDQYVYQVESASEDELVIDISGDLSLAENIATTTYMKQQSNGILDCFSNDLKNEMQDVDLMVINNEFCYSDRGTALAGKAYTFRANPLEVSNLSLLGVDLVSLANNHVYDYGEDAFNDTLDTLKIANMPYVGAGHNLAEAMTPIYYIAGGRKIAICAATQIERSNNYTKAATETSGGVLKTLYSENFCKEIAEAKENADYVVVICHWGTEGNSTYGADQTKLANDFVNAGADVIIGGHTHCLQGISYVGDVPVFYSLGNYWFSTTMNMPAAYDSGLAQIHINYTDGITTRFLPCDFSGGVTELSTSEKRTEILDKMRELSDGASIDDAGYVSPK